MSSLTSLSVNKNSTRFAPKVKARPVRRPAPQRKVAIGSEAKESDNGALNDSSPVQDTPHHPTEEVPVAIPSVSSTIPTVTATPPTNVSIPEPEEPQPTGIRIRRPRSVATVQRKPTMIAVQSSETATPENTVPSQQNTSHDDHTDEGPGGIQPHSKPTKKKGSAISIPLPSFSPDENKPVSASRTRKRPEEDDEDDEDERASKREKRKRKSKLQQQLEVEEMITLDDIQGDPAKQDYLKQPVSFFLKDLGTGVVSRLFKESERDRLSGEKGKKAAKKAEAEAEKENNEPLPEQTDTRQSSKRSALSESTHAAQVRLVNGEIVLDADSLQVERESQRPDVDFESMEVVEENAMSRQVSSNTWSKRQRSARWTADETELFYDALAQFGTDFEMVARLIPGRTRAQVRLKFSREEKTNAARVDDYLIRKKKPVDLQKYEEMTGVGLEEVPADFHEAQLN